MHLLSFVATNNVRSSSQPVDSGLGLSGSYETTNSHERNIVSIRLLNRLRKSLIYNSDSALVSESIDKISLCSLCWIGYFDSMFFDSVMKPLYVWLILLLICNAPIRGLNVLCVGESGHMELESAWSACCTADAQPSDQYNSELSGIDSDCGSCVDVTYRLDSALRGPVISETSSFELQYSTILSLPHCTDSLLNNILNFSRNGPDDSALLPLSISLYLCSVIRC